MHFLLQQIRLNFFHLLWDAYGSTCMRKLGANIWCHGPFNEKNNALKHIPGDQSMFRERNL